MNRQRITWVFCLILFVLFLCRCQMEESIPASTADVTWMPLPRWAEGAVFYRVPDSDLKAFAPAQFSSHLQKLGVQALWIDGADAASFADGSALRRQLRASGINLILTVDKPWNAMIMATLEVDGLVLARPDSLLITRAQQWQQSAPDHRLLLARGDSQSCITLKIHGTEAPHFAEYVRLTRRSRMRTSQLVSSVVDSAVAPVPPGRAILRLQSESDGEPMRELGVAALQGYLRFWAALPGFLVIDAGQEFALDRLPPAAMTSGAADVDSAVFTEYCELIKRHQQIQPLRRGDSEMVQTSMMDGSASTFLRSGEDGVVLVVANLRKEPAKMVLLTLNPSQLRKLSGSEFMSLDNSGGWIEKGNLFFREIAPFTTLLYLSDDSLHLGSGDGIERQK